MDGSDPIQDETVEKRGNRDGAACARLQYDPRHEHHGHSGNDRGDEGVTGLIHPQTRISIAQSVPDGLQKPQKARLTAETASSRQNKYKRRKLTPTPQSTEFPHSLRTKLPSEVVFARSANHPEQSFTTLVSAAPKLSHY
jgi:hypothetical protein